jgi:hypothetical protein
VPPVAIERCVLFAAEILAQQFQRHRAIQQGVPRLVNRAHAANTKRLEHNEMIERPLHPHFLSTFQTGQARERFRMGCVNRRSASRACLYHRRAPFNGHRTDCNIRKFQSNEVATATGKATGSLS